MWSISTRQLLSWHDTLMGKLASRVAGSRESDVAPPVMAWRNSPPIFGVDAKRSVGRSAGDTAAASPRADTWAMNWRREILFSVNRSVKCDKWLILIVRVSFLIQVNALSRGLSAVSC